MMIKEAILMRRVQLMVNKSSLLIVLSLLVVGCQDNSMQDLRIFVEETYADQKPEIEPLPVPRPYKNFVYSADALNDPFAKSNIAPAEEAPPTISIDDNRRKEELEAFPLDGLKLVGTLEQGEQPWIIVNASDGTAHRATIGNYMGQNQGRIVEILLDEQKAELIEVVKDPTGKWVDKSVILSVDEE